MNSTKICQTERYKSYDMMRGDKVLIHKRHCIFLRKCVYIYLASTRHLEAVYRPRDLDTLHLAVFAALVPDVFYDLLVFLVIQQLLGGHHVHQTQHLGGDAAHLVHGAVHQARHLQRHWRLVDPRLKQEA